MSDQECQKQLLPGVSRTFALTIPQLPHPLREVVTNAYLLCRIADTIEDDVQLTPQQKEGFHEQFRLVLAAQASSKSFADSLSTHLAPATPSAERNLIIQIPAVIRCLRSFTSIQQASLQRCVNIMSTGMPEFQRTASLSGLKNLLEMDKYCYYVAGVVGEMLTELFCEYSPEMNQKKEQLMSLAVSFGQGLQMTNILKDYHEDRERGVCWLPRDIFEKYGINLETIKNDNSLELAQGFEELVNIAGKHLRDAMEYTLLIPTSEVGIRRFTLWAIGLGVLTLRNIKKNPGFKSGAQVKISRKSVKATVLVSNVFCSSNKILFSIFNLLSKDLIYE
ncbi:MAG: squalene/phytoene synthase family protein [Proteobacteria bacterium]|nr:squalene/phytoene synthase family protein [Pseudomonadota bacterium]